MYVYNKSTRSRKKKREKEIKIKSKINKKKASDVFAYYSYYIILFCIVLPRLGIARGPTRRPGTRLLLLPVHV